MGYSICLLLTERSKLNFLNSFKVHEQNVEKTTEYTIGVLRVVYSQPVMVQAHIIADALQQGWSINS